MPGINVVLGTNRGEGAAPTLFFCNDRGNQQRFIAERVLFNPGFLGSSGKFVGNAHQ